MFLYSFYYDASYRAILLDNWISQFSFHGSLEVHEPLLQQSRVKKTNIYEVERSDYAKLHGLWACGESRSLLPSSRFYRINTSQDTDPDPKQAISPGSGFAFTVE